jgi:integrase
MRIRLSATDVTKLELPPGKTEEFFWDMDMPGLAVRVRNGGKEVSRRWAVRYRFGKEQVTEGAGDVRKVTGRDARKIARAIFAKIELGIDPRAERRRAEAEASAAKLNLGAVAQRYLDAKRGRLRQNTFQAAELHLLRYWKPLHARPIDFIKRANVAVVLGDLTRENGRYAAARAQSNLSACFSWAMKEGLCEVNPVVGTNDPAEGLPSRDRVLSDDEITTIWNACQEDEDFARIVRLLLLSGCRRDEIGNLKWTELTLDTGVMTIPGERTKNGRTLELTLPKLALDIIATIPRRAGKDYVFGARADRPFSGWSAGKLRLDARIAIATGKTIAAWRLHDLRRTMRTNLGRLGVRPDVAEMAINHVKGGDQGTYDRHTYQPEIKQALALWAAHVEAVVTGADNVTVLKRA